MTKMKRNSNPKRPTKRARSTRRLGQVRKARALGARDLDVALNRLNSSVQATITRSEVVLTAANRIAELAVERERQRIVDSLVKDGVLSAVDSIVSPSKNDPQLTREVIVGWLRRHLGLEPIHDPNDTLQIPAAKLHQVAVAGPYPSTGIVSVRVIESGWKSNGKALVPPGVVVAGE